MDTLRAVRPTVNRTPAPTERAAAAADGNPLQLAERLFGGPVHLVLVDDHGPAVSFLGWRISSSVLECTEDAGTTRSVTVEILYSQAAEYAVTERSLLRLADGASRLEATVTLFTSPKDVRRFLEAATGDPIHDMALAAALDHGARVWSWLRRAGRRSTNGTTPRLSL